MLDNTFNALFICTGNASRSIMAGGLMNSLADRRFKACSAGSHPNGAVKRLALQTLAALHIPTAGLRSKSWYEFAVPALALPITQLEPLAIQHEINQIGKR